MKKNLIFLFGFSLVISICVGLASTFFLSPADSVIIGFISYIMVSCVQILYENNIWREETVRELKKIEDKFELEASFRQISSFPVFFEDGIYELYKNKVESEIQSCKRNLDELSRGNLRIPKEISNEFWLKIIAHSRVSYKTTNLFSNNDSFGRSCEKYILDAQKIAIDRIGKENFIRIFIYSDKNDLERINSIIEKQKGIGVNIKTLSLEKYNELGQKNWSAIIGCSDFAIIDDRFVYVTVTDDSLDKKSYVELTSDHARVAAAKKFFELISKAVD